MPHIVVEATPRLAAALDFPELFGLIHRAIAAEGHARLEDFKSRVHVTQAHLAGVDPGGEFLLARLVITNPRPLETRQAMARVVHDTLRDAIAATEPGTWWQCCVLTEAFEKTAYLKTDSRG